MLHNLQRQKMDTSIQVPSKCQKCAKAGESRTHTKCNFCQHLNYLEADLCYLNRCVQEPAEFICHAFQPILKLAGPQEVKFPDKNKGQDFLQEDDFRKILDSEKIKYEGALALQRLSRDPDGVYVSLKYHFLWNVIYRKPIFIRNHEVIDFAHSIFPKCGDLVGGFVDLLWIAPDHVHICVVSDGEKSVERMVQEIKQFTGNAMLSQFDDTKERLSGASTLWDRAYFAQTIS